MKRQNAIRKNALSAFGFGTDAMKRLSVCSECFSLCSVGKTVCAKCGSHMNGTNLFSVYKSLHHCCEKCDAVLSVSMRYCPKCGTVIKKV